jgi:hypothetical protein
VKEDRFFKSDFLDPDTGLMEVLEERGRLDVQAQSERERARAEGLRKLKESWHSTPADERR